jgi:hypothetical protein
LQYEEKTKRVKEKRRIEEKKKKGRKIIHDLQFETVRI